MNWQLTEVGHVRDSFGCFDLMSIGRAELDFRMQAAWPRVVSEFVGHRDGFAGLANVDVGHTRQWLRSLNAAGQGAHICPMTLALTARRGCRRSVHGVLVRMVASTGFGFANILLTIVRIFLMTFGLLCLSSLKLSLPMVGDCCLSHSVRGFRCWLRYRSLFPMWPSGCLLRARMRIFTDGSCENQGIAPERFASWAFVVAPLHFHDSSCLFQDSGHLPGLLQSAYRSEVFAVLRALRFASAQGCPVHLWTDCNSVVLLLRKLLAGAPIPSNQPHGDLWYPILALIQAIGLDRVKITKVASHVEQLGCVSPLEAWCASWNAEADRVAGHTNLTRSDAFWTMLEKHRLASRAAHEISRTAQEVMHNISLQVLREADQTASLDVSDPPVVVVDGPQVPGWNVLPALTAWPLGAIRWYGARIVKLMLTWFWDAVGNQPTSPVRWISHFQLFVDFQMCTDEFGPVHDTKTNKWKDPGPSSLLGLENLSFKTRARWFTKVLKESLRHMQIQIPAMSCRPHCRYLNLHCGCMAIPWPEGRLDLVDAWFRSHLSAAAARDGRSLESLPQAGRHPPMPAVSVDASI